DVIPGIDIECNCLIEVDILLKGVGRPPLGPLHDVSPLVDESGYSGVRRPGYPSSRFDCAQLGVGQVLVFARSIAPPAVVGYNSNKLGTLLYVSGNIATPYGFITDNRRHANPTLGIKDRWFCLSAISAGGTAKCLK